MSEVKHRLILSPEMYAKLIKEGFELCSEPLLGNHHAVVMSDDISLTNNIPMTSGNDMPFSYFHEMFKDEEKRDKLKEELLDDHMILTRRGPFRD